MLALALSSPACVAKELISKVVPSAAVAASLAREGNLAVDIALLMLVSPMIVVVLRWPSVYPYCRVG